ncbi:hypothetical protein NQ314_010787 [Rhamnusium bicolor]|uniref:Exosome complex component RRP45 n=1 Tax=Rhamnusium bicolor TaxID=1586634 RepID=A0AAV8XNP7_9CUCU|nr:hypothetical protein NQ314_010787 [Rhamnusium bicolor]
MSSVRKTIVSNCEKKFLIKNLSEWTRLDGRAFDEFRKIDIEFGKDWGCCSVSLGKTRVLAQVSCEIQEPKSSRPSEGILNINIELNTIAAPHFESGRQSELSVQLNRLLEKCLKDSKAVDLESLCIKMKEKVWALRVDVNVLNHEGNILDCASVAALAALAHFRRPDVTCDGEEFIIHGYQQRDPIPTVIHHYPLCVTYSIFSGGHYEHREKYHLKIDFSDYIVADPTLLEEGVADAFLSIGLNAYKELCGLHLGGKAELTPDVILNTANKAAMRAGIVAQLIKDSVEEDSVKRQEKLELGFHKTIDNEKVVESIEELSLCLDQWTSKRKKNKKKKKQTKIFEENTIKMEAPRTESNLVAEIESIGKGSAALVPNDNRDNSEVWQASESEDDDDVMIVEQPKQVVDLLDIADSGSEEEAVIVLNSEKKSKKKKKKVKTEY